MKSLRKKLVVPILVGLMALSSIPTYASSMPVSAAKVPTPRWNYVTMISSGMDVDDKNIAKISVTVDADIFKVNKIVVKCELQQLANNNWKTIKTWKDEKKDSYIMYTKNYAIAKNYSYRLKITADVYFDNSLLETANSYYDYGYYH